MRNWITYIFVLGFGAYWASNLLLWHPWSYSSTLGITLMLTVAPLLWAYVTYLGLKTCPGPKWFAGAFWISVIFMFLAVLMDYVFFGHIRGAMEELYQPTTFYGYGFLVFLPVMLGYFLRHRIQKHQRPVKASEVRRALWAGLVCFGILFGILLLE